MTFEAVRALKVAEPGMTRQMQIRLAIACLSMFCIVDPASLIDEGAVPEFEAK